ncbi:MFS transporter [Aquabacterium sp.]|uniref:MFS transporter n=1 Tax=Aquabacterium sp. TaxID=1872578 RepID=UPI002D016D5F|nr:MFS transporter [Aquabacterium sp.]HSW08407.1 MFS transporter [Aquabacterium sp.]
MQLQTTAPLPPAARPFYGTTVVRAAFVLAAFGWGVGFYSPSIFLHAVAARTGWSLPLVSAAVTFHFMFGALMVARLPRIHARWGIALTTAAGAAALALGTMGWAVAAQPWQLFAAALLSGAGWVTMGAAAINAILSPWFVHSRPMALAKAYNGASIGGVIFSPLWAALIAHLGFTAAALLVAVVMLTVVAAISLRVLVQTPEALHQRPDGDAPGVATRSITSARARPLPGRLLWRDRGFLTLAAGMSLSLFAQAGLIAHLYALLAAALSTQAAGWAMALVTACAVAGRTVVAKIMPATADRRRIAAASYAVQVAGSLVLLAASGQQTALLLFGIVLFGVGIGNATSLPPLVAQVEFVKEDMARVVALIVAISQGLWALAPVAFGILLAAGDGSSAQLGAGTQLFFTTAALIQLGAIACMLAGRKPLR